MSRHVHSLKVRLEGATGQQQLRFEHTIDGTFQADIKPQLFAEKDVVELAKKVSLLLHGALAAHAEYEILNYELVEVGKLLYSAIFPSTTPLAASLQKVETTVNAYLILDLSKSLLWIPWELLHDGQYFLCERFRMARHLEQTEEELNLLETRLQDKRNGCGAVIALGDIRGLDIKAEQETIYLQLGELYGEYVEKTNPEDTASLLQRLRKNYEIFHFIGHARYNEADTEQSGWLCKGGAVLRAREVRNISTQEKFPLLIFANACDSARSSVTAQEDQIGALYYAFLKQQVPHYIGTLARVPDELSGQFARSFYEGIAAKRSIGEALHNARLELRRSSEVPIWAYYVHYGDPRSRLVQEDSPFIPAKPAPPASRAGGMKQYLKTLRAQSLLRSPLAFPATILCTLLAVLALLGWHYGLQDYFKRFPSNTFGVAVTPLIVTDVSRGTSEHAESLLSTEEIRSTIKSFVQKSDIETIQFKTPIRSHDEARRWGTGKKAAMVLWGSVERSTSGMVVRLHATRLAFPEVRNQKETFKRFFLYMLFEDLFRDEHSYASDFDLNEMPVDLSHPQELGMVYRQAIMLTALLRAIGFYAEGNYGESAGILDRLASASQPASLDLKILAKRWLTLTYLNKKDYEAALKEFSPLAESASSNENIIVLAFLRFCCERYSFWPRTVIPQPEVVKPLQQACVSTTLSPQLKGACVAMLTAGLPVGSSDSNRSHHLPDVFNNLQSLIESAIAEAPESYFLRCLLAMVSPDPAVAEEALRKAEELKPDASEPHFARSLFFGLMPEGNLAAINSLDKAISAEPSVAEYWFDKLSRLEVLKSSAIGNNVSKILAEQIALENAFLGTPYGSGEERIRMLRYLALDYQNAGQTTPAIATLKRLVKEFPGRSNSLFAAALALTIGAFQEAQDFCIAAARVVTDPDPNDGQLWAEIQWRCGNFDEAIKVYANDVFRGHWTESHALLDTVGNILHTAGRYAEAEVALAAAERLATI